MKKYLLYIGMAFATLLIGSGVAYAVGVTVPSAPSAGYTLVSTSTGNYNYTSLTPFTVGAITSTSTATSIFAGPFQLSALGTSGNPCLTVNNTGVISTQSCSSAASNYLTNIGATTYLNIGSILAAQSFNATSTATSTLPNIYSNNIGINNPTPVANLDVIGNAFIGSGLIDSAWYSGSTVLNGDFESTSNGVFSNWASSTTATSQVLIDTSNPHSGLNDAEFIVDASNGIAQLISTAKMVNGTTYRVSFWAKGAVGGEKLGIGDASNTNAQFKVTLTTSYALYSGTFVADVNAGIAIKRIAVAGNSQTFYVDDVQVINVSANHGMATSTLSVNGTLGVTGTTTLSSSLSGVAFALNGLISTISSTTIPFNVRDYGAIGNGVVDDTAAINAALTAQQTRLGGKIFFPPGHYNYCGTLSSTGGFPLIIEGVSSANQVTPSNSEIIETCDNTKLIDLTNSRDMVSNVMLFSKNYQNPYTNTSSAGIDFENGTNFNITNNVYISNFAYGIYALNVGALGGDTYQNSFQNVWVNGYSITGIYYTGGSTTNWLQTYVQNLGGSNTPPKVTITSATYSGTTLTLNGTIPYWWQPGMQVFVTGLTGSPSLNNAYFIIATSTGNVVLNTLTALGTTVGTTGASSVTEPDEFSTGPDVVLGNDNELNGLDIEHDISTAGVPHLDIVDNGGYTNIGDLHMEAEFSTSTNSDLILNQQATRIGVMRLINIGYMPDTIDQVAYNEHNPTASLNIGTVTMSNIYHVGSSWVFASTSIGTSETNIVLGNIASSTISLAGGNSSFDSYGQVVTPLLTQYTGTSSILTAGTGISLLGSIINSAWNAIGTSLDLITGSNIVVGNITATSTATSTLPNIYSTNIGIGNPSPVANLDVIGNAFVGNGLLDSSWYSGTAILNGDFESSSAGKFSSWATSTAGTSQILVDTSTPHSGLNDAEFIVDSSGSVTQLDSSLQLTTGTPYRVTFWAKGAVGGEKITTGGGSFTGTVFNVTLTNAYAEYSGIIVPGAGGTFDMKRLAVAGNSQTFYVDDVQIYSMAPNHGFATSTLSVNGSLGVTGTTTSNYFIATSTTNPSQFQDVVATGPSVDPRAFGALCNGVANDTAAFNAAIATLPNGGTVLVPKGKCPVNLVITTSGINFLGQDIAVHQAQNGSTAINNLLVAAASTSPIIQVSNDNQTVYATSFTNVGFSGDYGPDSSAFGLKAQIGVELAGGAWDTTFLNVSWKDFTKYSLVEKQGLNYPIDYSSITNFNFDDSVANIAQIGDILNGVYDATSTAYVGQMSFVNGHIHTCGDGTPCAGYALQDDMTFFTFSDLYMDAQNNGGFDFLMSTSTLISNGTALLAPTVKLVNSVFDSESSTDNLITISTTTPLVWGINQYVESYGTIIDGFLNQPLTLSGGSIDYSAAQDSYDSGHYQLNNPQVNGTLSFGNNNDLGQPWDFANRITLDGSNNLDVISTGNIVLDPGGTKVATVSSSTGAFNISQYGSYMQNNSTILQASTSINTIFAGVGAGVALENVGGNGSAVFGTDALNVSTSSQASAAFGFDAMLNYEGTGNDQDTAIGTQSQQNNLTGLQDTSLGNSSLQDMTIANRDTALGYKAGQNETGGDNTLVGANAGINITTGIDNTALGSWNNSNPLTTGNQNILIGFNTNLASSTSNGQLDIGNLIYGTNLTGTGSIVSNGDIGIGTTSPFAVLSVSNSLSDVQGTPLFAVASTTSSIATSTVFEIDAKGHQITSGVAPTVSGGTSSIVSPSNDNAGQISVVGTALTSVTLTFGTPWATAPECVESDNQLVVASDITSVSTSQIVFGFGTGGVTTATIWYRCTGTQ